MSLEQNLLRLMLFKYGGLALLFLGFAASLALVIGDAEGLPRRTWARYVVYLERKLRLMFVWTPGDRIASAQVAGMALCFALSTQVHTVLKPCPSSAPFLTLR